MKRRPRIPYTESQKTLVWEHWRKGDPLQKIAHLFDRNWACGSIRARGDLQRTGHDPIRRAYFPPFPPLHDCENRSPHYTLAP